MVGDLLQPTHLLFVLVVALLVLGPKRLPEVGRALGRGLRDFRSAISGEEPPEKTIDPADEPEASTSTPVHQSAAPVDPSTSTAPAQPGISTPSAAETPEPEAPTETAEAVTSSVRPDSAT